MSSSLKKKYTKTHLVVDVVLTFLTGGLWLIVIFIQFMRRNS